MAQGFIYSFQAEWLKKKRTAASWLTIIGGFFIPVILLAGRFTNIPQLIETNASPSGWDSLFGKSWQFMALFLLPMGVILATCLVTQLEFRNNTWKQLHTTPQRLTVVFFAKLLVIIFMMLQFFILFNIGIYLMGVIPAIFIKGAQYPVQPFPWRLALEGSGRYFIDCLPIIALQYLISLRFRNFLVALGAGLGLLVASLIALSWQYGYIVPYTYCAYNFLGARVLANQPVSIHTLAMGYFLLFMLVGYVLYIKRKEKG